MKHFTKLLSLAVATVFCGNVAQAQDFNGFCLYNSQNSNTAYLIDEDGSIAHSWSCDDACNYAVLLKPNGNLIRGAVKNGNQLNGAAVGGMVQEIDPNGDVVWEFEYSNSDHVSHHDIEQMPNGNVLLIAWEVKSTAELTQAGFDNPSSEKWPTHIIEVAQDGTGGEIVWEWHIWDHMIQDHDASKDNYGVIADHPELIDVNGVTSTGGGPGGGGGGPGGGGGDWFHVNGIDYNESLDQIVFSSRYLSEIFIIDHSTTTAEAAGHTGGNSGMGGDFLYRWGNPANYDHPGTQIFTGPVHDPRWIEDDGRPRGGWIQVFNNEGNSGGSAVDAINPPLNGYNYTYTQGQQYAPSTYDFRHECLDDADGQSAQNTMSNGNVFVCLSGEYLYEVDQNDNIVWQYSAATAKAFRYECDYAGIVSLLGSQACPVGVEEISEADINLYPNPSTGVFEVPGFELMNSDVEIFVHDIYGKQVRSLSNTTVIDLTGEAEGIYFITFTFDNAQSITKKVSLVH